MSPEARFEQLLEALLDVTPTPATAGSVAPDESPGDVLLEELLVLQDIASAHRQLMRGEAAAVVASTSRALRWGHLELQEPVGRGASATVYRAWDPALGRWVALKLFDTALAAPAHALREGQLLAQLRHAHRARRCRDHCFRPASSGWSGA